MKEFDYVLAKAGKPVQTRDGREARILCFDTKSEYGNILALVTHKDGQEYPHVYYDNGRFYRKDNGYNPDDLVMAPEKHVGWVNLYRRENGKVDVGVLMNSEQEAKDRVDMTYSSYVATVKVEWEE